MSAVFVTGATGTVGLPTVNGLLERGADVVAGVRSEADAEALPAGAQSRPFEFGAPAGDIDAALDGCTALFLMRPPAIADVETFLFPVIDAAMRRGMEQIVFLSLQGVQGNRSTPHHAVEAYLRQVKAPYTMLRPNFFMQNLETAYVSAIRERGELFVPAGRSRTAFIDARDIGRVAAAVLTEPGHVRKAYTLSGEQSLTYKKVAQIMSEELGRPITYRRPSEAEFLDGLRKQGLPEDYIAVQKMIHRVVRMNVSAFPNRRVRALTGQPATTMAQYVRDRADAFAPRD
ncbi:SDR family oxidoreductase [Demequina globuliformis]|uniref:SDR family oxidoreductase n=1 Tax=Demequina globuliformis TaxID=676202 RepID=UPI000780A2EA|nr:SDR family oxidoreductase [Demequina globuliformis]